MLAATKVDVQLWPLISSFLNETASLLKGSCCVQAGVESGENTSETGLLEDLRLIGYMLEAGNMAELLQGAFQCAWPGFSTEFAKALLSSPPFQASRTIVVPLSASAMPRHIVPILWLAQFPHNGGALK